MKVDKKNQSLKINEIFKSIQGESTQAGLQCVFIRLSYCNLRCTHCDTEYAFHDGKTMKIDDIIEQIKSYNIKTVEVTGGEPLLQKNCITLLRKLLDTNYNVMLETSGSISLRDVPKNVKKIVDFKCPSSNMSKHNKWSILEDIDKSDEIKFVIGDLEDYNWAKSKINKFNLTTKATILFSPVFESMILQDLAEWIIRDNIDVRLQMQMHKYIWDPDKRAV